MKKAKWILALLSALSLQVSATDFSKIENGLNSKMIQKHLHAKLHMAGEDSSAPPASVPIRQTNVNVSIYKTTLTKNSSGGYDSANTFICNTTTIFNVYDCRTAEIQLSAADQDRVQCAATLQGNPMVVHLGGALMLSNGNLFGTPQDFLIGDPFLYYATPATGTSPTSDFAFDVAGSTDLAAKSMLSSLTPSDVIESCVTDSSGNQTCTVPINEYFSAVVNIQD